MKNNIVEKVPNKAFSFIDTGETFAKANDSGFEMLGYSGGVIKDHWWWGDLIINVEGMSFPKAKIPILAQHDIERKIGFSNRPIASDKILFNQITFLDNEHSKSFKDDSIAGFPFEASISAQPTEVLRLEKGVKMTVNGKNVKGPITVWNKAVFKECSVCVFGADSNTKSKAFDEKSDEYEEFSIEIIGQQAASSFDHLEPTNVTGVLPGTVNDKLPPGEKPEGAIMNKEELKKKHPELYQEIHGLGMTEGETNMSAAVISAKTEGATAEASRIKDVRAQILPGHEELVETLAADGKTTGPEAAQAVLLAEKTKLKAASASIDNNAPPSLPEPNTDGADDDKGAVDMNLPVEDRAKAEWDKSPKLRDEFNNDLKSFESYMVATEGNRVKVLTK